MNQMHTSDSVLTGSPNRMAMFQPKLKGVTVGGHTDSMNDASSFPCTLCLRHLPMQPQERSTSVLLPWRVLSAGILKAFTSSGRFQGSAAPETY